jgi:hypothetical protein
MMRTFLALLVLAITAVPASAACRWAGTELDCSVGGTPLLIGSPMGGDQPNASPSLQGFSGRLGFGAGQDSGFGLALQHFDPNAIHCWQLGNERYCY